MTLTYRNPDDGSTSPMVDKVNRTRNGWSMFHAAEVDLRVSTTTSVNIGDYQFNVVLNSPETGFYFNTSFRNCLGTLSAISTNWFKLNPFFPERRLYIMRCGLGLDANSGIDVLYRIANPVGPEHRIQATGPLTQAQHWDNTPLEYTVRMDSLSGVMPDYLTLGEHGFDPYVARVEAAVPIDGPVAASKAVADWVRAANDRKFISKGGSNVTIKGYWHNPNVVDGKCGSTRTDLLGCAKSPGNPHIEYGEVWIKYPPEGLNKDGEITEWTTSAHKVIDDPDRYFYLPWVMQHEIGHALGLGHNGSGNIMYQYYEWPTALIATDEDEHGILEVLLPHHTGSGK